MLFFGLLEQECSGEMSDSQFPDWTAVSCYFEKCSKNGSLERFNRTANRLALNILERKQPRRIATPSLGVTDSQSIKLAPMIAEDRGIDENKRVNRRKKHLLVDIKGRIWKTQVHAANIHDIPGEASLLENFKQIIPTLKKYDR